MQQFALGKCIANLKDAVVGQTHDISGPSFIDGFLTLCHELSRTAETHRLTVTHMQIWSITDKLARTNLAEGNTTAMVGVDVGRYLEDKTCEFILFGFHLTLLRFRRTWVRRNLHKAVQQFLNTKVVKG